MSGFQRTQGRAADALRPVSLTRGYTVHAEGSVLVAFGATKVLCTASVEEKVPPHKRGSGEGWLTAGDLPPPKARVALMLALAAGWDSATRQTCLPTF